MPAQKDRFQLLAEGMESAQLCRFHKAKNQETFFLNLREISIARRIELLYQMSRTYPQTLKQG